jgi:hypothetical protein
MAATGLPGITVSFWFVNASSFAAVNVSIRPAIAITATSRAETFKFTFVLFAFPGVFSIAKILAGLGSAFLFKLDEKLRAIGSEHFQVCIGCSPFRHDFSTLLAFCNLASWSRIILSPFPYWSR